MGRTLEDLVELFDELDLVSVEAVLLLASFVVVPFDERRLLLLQLDHILLSLGQLDLELQKLKDRSDQLRVRPAGKATCREPRWEDYEPWRRSPSPSSTGWRPPQAPFGSGEMKARLKSQRVPHIDVRAVALELTAS